VSPVISVTAGGTINFGSTATLTASGVSTYTWSANAASATTASVSVSPTVTTTYSVVGTNSVGCLSNMATSTVSINGAALNFDGSNDSVSIGHTMNTALFNKTSVTVESWIYPTSFAGSYKTIIGNYSTPLNQMQFDMRLQGNSVTFFVSAGSGYRQVLSAPNTITLNTWQHVAGVWDGNNLMIYVNGVLSATQTGITGSLVATTNDIVIGGNTIPENFVGSIDEVRIWTRALCQGEIQNSMNGELILPQTGLLAYYQFNEGVSAGSNSTVTALTDVTGNGYNGTLTNMALTGATSNWVAPGGVTTGSVAPAFVSPSIAVSGTTTICAGATTTLTAAGNVSTYTWTAGPATAAYTVNPTSNATYSVVGTNSVGCNSNMALATVTVNALPTVGVNSQAICTGNAAALTATGAATYTWSTTETTATIAPTPTAATTDYTVTGTDANNCMNSAVATVTVNALPTLTVTASASVICAGATSTLTATGADTYTWSTSDYTAATIVTPTATTTDYTVTGTDVNNCMNSAVSTVTVNALPTLTVTVNTATVCAGTMDMISVNGTPTSYTWSTGVNTTSITPTPTVTSSYTVTGTDGNNCMNMAVATINVNALPTLTITPSDTIICPGAMVTLTANGATTYTWSTSQTTGSIVATPTANATYSVSGTDGNGCTGMSSTNVTVTICAGIAKYSNNINVSIYPNPSKGEFTIASANYAENTTLTIYNAIGQAVYTTKLNSALQTINANLANGMYVIRLQNAQGTGMQHIVITE
ncbi:MAG: LamG-like jellyroll fold domain-containing protein, partial [Bacteroidia bacterium]